MNGAQQGKDTAGEIQNRTINMHFVKESFSTYVCNKVQNSSNNLSKFIKTTIWKPKTTKNRTSNLNLETYNYKKHV